MAVLTGQANTGLPWHNGDGLDVKFPSYYRNAANFVNRPWALKTFGSTKQLEIEVDLTQIPTGTTWATADSNNDGTSDSFQEEDPYIPANASVTKVTWVTTVAATGGTSITIGTYQQNGTTISANSLMTATEGAIANMATIGFRIYGNGALLSTSAGTAGVGVNNAFVGITTNGTFTAGTGRLIIDYIDNRLSDLFTNN